MSAVAIGGEGLLFNPTNTQTPEGYTLTSQTTLDAVGESCAAIGQLHLSDRGTSKSLVGATLWFRTGSGTTLNDAGSNFRVGIQDLGASGFEDGTFDIYKDFTGGGGVLQNNTWQGHVLSTGSKTVSHGDILAICFELTARGGTDSVKIQYPQNSVPAVSSGFPYGTSDTGSLLKTPTLIPAALLVLSDGTIGRIDNTWSWTDPDQDPVNTTTQTGLYFVAPFTGKIDKVIFGVTDSVATTDMWTITVWGTPLGTPTSLGTYSVQGQNRANTSVVRQEFFRFPTPISVTAGAEYAITAHTTVGTINTAFINLGTGNGSFRKITALGENWCRCTRTIPSSSPFTLTNYHLPSIAFAYSEIDTSSSGGGNFTFG